MLIKRGQESLQRVIKNVPQLAALRNDALIPRRKTFDQSEVGFGCPNDISKSDLLGRFPETKSARAASNSRQITGARQRVDDFIEMGSRNFVCVGNFINRDQSIARCMREHQHPQREIGKQS
jgi:hypothetical protein